MHSGSAYAHQGYLSLFVRGMRGVTLLELMVTVSIVAILASVAVPSFQSMMTTNSLATATNGFVAALQLARSEAITRSKTVTLCKSNDVSDSTPSCNTSANWQDGWVVFVDSDKDGTLDSGEEILRVQQALNGNTAIDGKTNFANFIKFNNAGISKGSSFSNGSFEVTSSSDSRCIRINNIGRIRTQTGSCP